MRSQLMDPSPAPAPRPQVRDRRVRRLLRRLFEPFWAVPALWCLAAVTLGVTLPSLESDAGGWMPLPFDGGVDGARAVLSTIAGAMISVTGLVFSITIVVLQLASSQFTPRVLRTFLDDRITQNTLGVFTASFLYSLTVLRSVGNQDGPGDAPETPQLAVTVAFLLVLGAVAMFLAFIHHIANAISVDTIIRQVADQTRGLIRRSRDRAAEMPWEEPDLAARRLQRVARATSTGYLDAIDPDRLLQLACAEDARIELLYPLGSFVPQGAPIALVHTDTDAVDDWDARVGRSLSLRRERTMEQDVTFGFRRLVDIAERALSPGVNDPTTAVQVLDELHEILRGMAARKDPYPVLQDTGGIARLVTREWTFSKYLDLAVDEIAHWGADSLQIPARLNDLLEDLGVVAEDSHRDAVRRKVEALAPGPGGRQTGRSGAERTGETRT